MTPSPPSDRDARPARLATYRAQFDADAVAAVEGDLAGAACIAATRRGLFAVGIDAAKRLIDGYYFGLAWHDGALYAFQSCDDPYRQTGMGRILVFPRDGERLGSGHVLCKGLDNGCHQIAFAGDELLVVDTHNQQVQRIGRDGRHHGTIHPVPPLVPGSDGHYAHINALALVGARPHLLLHNGHAAQPRPSEIMVFDAGWQLQARYALAGHGCHDIVALEDGRLLHCGSEAGELIGPDGLRLCLTDRLTRGLAIDADQVMVGASVRAPRHEREEAGGSVIFLDRAYRRLGEVEVPGAPTCLIALRLAGPS